jgi:hypothetical protein
MMGRASIFSIWETWFVKLNAGVLSRTQPLTKHNILIAPWFRPAKIIDNLLITKPPPYKLFHLRLVMFRQYMTSKTGFWSFFPNFGLQKRLYPIPFINHKNRSSTSH